MRDEEHRPLSEGVRDILYFEMYILINEICKVHFNNSKCTFLQF